MEDIMFGTIDGKIIGSLGSVTEEELGEPSVLDDLVLRKYEAILKNDSELDDFMKAVLGQGSYNAWKLKRDGYLSPANGWINGLSD